MSTSNLAQEVTQTQRLSIYDSDFTIDLRVLFTYKIIFPSDANIIDISTSFNGLLPSRIVINDRMSVSLETQGYMGFYPSGIAIMFYVQVHELFVVYMHGLGWIIVWFF